MKIDFSLKNEKGKNVSLNDFKGKFLALYFYPKDMTSGCTDEACNLRDNYEKLKKENIEIVGISMDDELSHNNFKEMHALPFQLLCDTTGEVSKKYGVYKKKSFFWKKASGIKRTTFIISPEGEIKKVIKDVDVKNHADQIINAVKE